MREDRHLCRKQREVLQDKRIVTQSSVTAANRRSEVHEPKKMTGQRSSCDFGMSCQQSHRVYRPVVRRPFQPLQSNSDESPLSTTDTQRIVRDIVLPRSLGDGTLLLMQKPSGKTTFSITEAWSLSANGLGSGEVGDKLLVRSRRDQIVTRNVILVFALVCKKANFTMDCNAALVPKRRSHSSSP
jgi:hypothetical protein